MKLETQISANGGKPFMQAMDTGAVSAAGSEPFIYGGYLEAWFRCLKLSKQYIHNCRIHVRSAHYINNDEPEKYMQMALESMLRIANDNNIRSLAMPAIGTGMFKFPAVFAARIICQSLNRADELAPFLQTVRICLTDTDMVQLFESANVEVQTSTI